MPGRKSSSLLSCCFTGEGSSARDDDTRDDYWRAYKVYPSDQDKGRYVAEPGIDRKASAYISLRTNKWRSD